MKGLLNDLLSALVWALPTYTLIALLMVAGIGKV